MMPILAVEALSKKFGTLQAVQSVQFHINPGEIYGLLGPNGAGKTTTISMICGLLKPDTGKISILGENFWLSPKKAQKQMGVVPQEIALYEELSGEENLVFWGKIAGLQKKQAELRAQELLEALGLLDRRKEAVKNYSGGMKRRINLGCALMHQPKLLLLDEPTVGIDPQARLTILEFIQNLAKQGNAILYTTHYLEEAEKLCHRMGIIDQGRLLAEGTLTQLQNQLNASQIFLIEAPFQKESYQEWPDLMNHFKILQTSDSQMIVSPKNDQTPAESLQLILKLPLTIQNITLKKPTLNDVFLQLTGRELRD
ncbi:MAG: ABC transporter ATP-binding protein [Planctomycetota bacterium]